MAIWSPKRNKEIDSFISLFCFMTAVQKNVSPEMTLLRKELDTKTLEKGALFLLAAKF